VAIGVWERGAKVRRAASGVQSAPAGADIMVMSPLALIPRLSARRRVHLERWASSALLAPVAWMLAFEGGGTWFGRALWMVMHSFNLIVHESGHFFFRFFGRFMEIAGATILELALPALFVFQGIYWHHRLGTQLALLWLGQAFVGVSVYAADAQARALPLIGNLGPESHDWHNMLSMLGILEHTPLVAGAFYASGVICWIAMLLVPAKVW
jgi:hypothetical protein